VCEASSVSFHLQPEKMKLATGFLLATALLVAWIEFGVANPQSVKANIHVSVGGEKGQCAWVGKGCKKGADCQYIPGRGLLCCCNTGQCARLGDKCSINADCCPRLTCKHFQQLPSRCYFSRVSVGGEKSHCAFVGDDCKKGADCQQIPGRGLICCCASGPGQCAHFGDKCSIDADCCLGLTCQKLNKDKLCLRGRPALSSGMISASDAFSAGGRGTERVSQ